MSEAPASRERWDGWLGPKLWAPLVGALGLGVIALGTLLLVGFGDGGTTVVHKECKVGEPGCELRPETHEHADFAVFLRGKQFDFGQPQFVSHEGAELSEDAHIHDPRHTVVHIHRQGTTWDELFRSLGFELTDATLGAQAGRACLKMPSGDKLCESATETFKFYVNGVRVDGIAGRDLHDLDRTLISFGTETPEQVLRDQAPKLTDEACIPSEVCKDRLPPGGEAAEPCSKNSTTCR